MKHLHVNNILVWVQTRITVNICVRGDLILVLSKIQTCKVDTFTITSTYTSRLYHNTSSSPSVKHNAH